MRAVILALALSGCIQIEPEDYVLRSFSIDASHGSIGATWTFDNKQLPQQGGDCIGIEVCTTE